MNWNIFPPTKRKEELVIEEITQLKDVLKLRLKTQSLKIGDICHFQVFDKCKAVCFFEIYLERLSVDLGLWPSSRSDNANTAGYIELPESMTLTFVLGIPILSNSLLLRLQILNMATCFNIWYVCLNFIRPLRCNRLGLRSFSGG